jgi:hypothetical protein
VGNWLRRVWRWFHAPRAIELGEVSPQWLQQYYESTHGEAFEKHPY